MIITLKKGITQSRIDALKDRLKQQCFPFWEAHWEGYPLFILSEDTPSDIVEWMDAEEAVESIVPVSTPYQLAGSDFKADRTRITIGNEEIGGNALNLVAGPCSVESRSQIFEVAHFLSELGIKFLRGGAYKPRTSPYSFQGLEEGGLAMLREAADRYNMLVVTELLDYNLINTVAPYADIFQVGSRNMFNYYLLKQLGHTKHPVLLKRGMFASIQEWLLAAEYILLEGNPNVILCERGIRSYDSAVRNNMDIAAIPLIRQLSHLPIWADPSQGTGKQHLIEPMSKASVAAGADGLMIETHPDPDKALSDGAQSLDLNTYAHLVKAIQPFIDASDKKSYISGQLAFQ